ncbi:uncharacterized protein BXZ73DRAFT_103113 [Epithele typhae]|uniref:uncharacterized protein n=1 Tax=Epithele typhae TaxID=378194 RepID=UPI0020081E67|nr:uncharacterized protein BXZ73DRAFT_103113 [Epithele typhae]KAH9925949.1 hypothetical protein BXZ73DRAFT_103113 [Epithele typhae]
MSRVSKAHRPVALARLWSHLEYFSPLLNVFTKYDHKKRWILPTEPPSDEEWERFDIYAGYVQIIDDVGYMQRFSGDWQTFSRTGILAIAPSCLISLQHIKFRLEGSGSSNEPLEEVLSILASNATSLSSLEIKADDEVTFAVETLQTFSSLESLSLRTDTPLEALSHLGNMGLHHFEVNAEFPPDFGYEEFRGMTRTILAGGTHPFPPRIKLRVTYDYEEEQRSFPDALAPIAGTVEHLTALIGDPENYPHESGDVLESFASLSPTLALHRLASVHIDLSPNVLLTTPTLPTWLPRGPFSAESTSLKAWAPLPAPGRPRRPRHSSYVPHRPRLRSFAEHCPNLQELELFSDIDFNDVDDALDDLPEPLGHRLQLLWTATVDPDIELDESHPARMATAKYVDRLFPHLDLAPGPSPNIWPGLFVKRTSVFYDVGKLLMQFQAERREAEAA